MLNNLKGKFSGNAFDSLALTFVTVVTTVLGLVVSKLMSMHFSLTDYGTYSQAMLIVSTVTSVTILGLTNATNYFYNSVTDEKQKYDNISTVFAIQYVVGIIGGIVVLALTVPIVKYFDNEALGKLIIFIAFMPLLNNLIPMFQVLFVSIGKAKLIAARNFVFSVLRLIAVIIACYVTNSITTIIALLLVLDVAQVVYFFAVFAYKKFYVNPFKAKKELIMPILRFSIPMAVFVLCNVLSRDIDKYVVSAFSNTETLAIYTNASKQLPFDFVTTSFMTVLVPVITRQINEKKFSDGVATFKSYLRIGYLSTWIIAAGTIVIAPELIVFLYDKKFLPGLWVFIVYIFVDMIRFANANTVLAGAGKTGTLMIISICVLSANTVLNIIAYMLFGIIGPAITTLLLTFAMCVVMLCFGAKELKCRLLDLFDFKEMGLLSLEIIVVGAIAFFLKNSLYKFMSNNFLIMAITYGFYFVIVAALNLKKVMSCMKDLNK